MLKNESGLHPKGHAVLVRTVELEEMKASLIHIPASVRTTSAAMEHRAVVVEIGAEAWIEEKEPRAKVGDKVMITRMAGFVAVGNDELVYRLVNDRDIFCSVDAKAEVANG